MANELYDLLKEFKRENLVTWLKEAISFFRSPRNFVQSISKRQAVDLIPQYAFYFLIYTFSFIFFSIGFSLNDLLRPALLNFTRIVPAILIFSFSAYIATRTNYLKKTLVFIISLNLFLSPLLIIFYSLFLNSEDYLYKLALGVTSLLSTVFMVLGYGFVIEAKSKRALKIVLLNYVVINVVWLFVIRINFDEDGGIIPLQNVDPIFEEYITATRSLKEKDRIPMNRLVASYNDKVFLTFTTQELISGTVASGNTKSNKIYKAAIELNLQQIDESLKAVKFQRNKNILLQWKEYFDAVSREINYTISDTDELNSLHLQPLPLTDSNGIRMYTMPISLDSTFPLQVRLKRYHNNLMRSSQKSELPGELSDNITFFMGKAIDAGLFELLNEGKPRPYKEKFLPVE